MTKQISINISAVDDGTINALVSQIPLVNRHALGRLALRIGLRALAQSPERIPEWLQGQSVHVVVGG